MISSDKSVHPMWKIRVFDKTSWLFLAFHRPSWVFLFPSFSFQMFLLYCWVSYFSLMSNRGRWQKTNRSRAISFIRTLSENTMSAVAYKDVHLCNGLKVAQMQESMGTTTTSEFVLRAEALGVEKWIQVLWFYVFRSSCLHVSTPSLLRK